MSSALSPIEAPESAPTDSPALDLQAMREHAGQAVAMLKLLGNEDRLLLLCQMAECERTVGELQELTGIEQPTL